MGKSKAIKVSNSFHAWLWKQVKGRENLEDVLHRLTGYKGRGRSK